MLGMPKCDHFFLTHIYKDHLDISIPYPRCYIIKEEIMAITNFIPQVIR